MKSLGIVRALALALVLLLAACQDLAGLAAPRPATATPSPTGGPFRPRVEVVATGLEVPWALAFATVLPGGSDAAGPGPYLFVTERPGRLRLIAGGRLLPQLLGSLPVAAVGEAGLMGLALDPDFARNGYLYVAYTYRDGAGLHNRLVRFTLAGLRLTDEKILLDGIPAATVHDGGGLGFGPDGKLYVTTGDARQPDQAQRLNSLSGKVLRLNSDGSVPTDNPFPGSPVYSFGHRNPQGLAWQPGTGQLFASEHGPSGGVDGFNCCHDEINRILPGQNYGWPTVFGRAGDPRFVDPVHESGNATWAPAGAVFYTGNLLATWRGSLFFGTLRGVHLHRLVLGGQQQAQVVGEEELFVGQYGRIRAVAVGPDGALYFTTSNRDGRYAAGPDDDRVLRVLPGP